MKWTRIWLFTISAGMATAFACGRKKEGDDSPAPSTTTTTVPRNLSAGQTPAGQPAPGGQPPGAQPTPAQPAAPAQDCMVPFFNKYTAKSAIMAVNKNTSWGVDEANLRRLIAGETSVTFPSTRNSYRNWNGHITGWSGTSLDIPTSNSGGISHSEALRPTWTPIVRTLNALGNDPTSFTIISMELADVVDYFLTNPNPVGTFASYPLTEGTNLHTAELHEFRRYTSRLSHISAVPFKAQEWSIFPAYTIYRRVYINALDGIVTADSMKDILDASSPMSNTLWVGDLWQEREGSLTKEFPAGDCLRARNFQKIRFIIPKTPMPASGRYQVDPAGRRLAIGNGGGYAIEQKSYTLENFIRLLDYRYIYTNFSMTFSSPAAEILATGRVTDAVNLVNWMEKLKQLQAAGLQIEILAL